MLIFWSLCWKFVWLRHDATQWVIVEVHSVIWLDWHLMALEEAWRLHLSTRYQVYFEIHHLGNKCSRYTPEIHTLGYHICGIVLPTTYCTIFGKVKHYIQLFQKCCFFRHKNIRFFSSVFLGVASLRPLSLSIALLTASRSWRRFLVNSENSFFAKSIASTDEMLIHICPS